MKKKILLSIIILSLLISCQSFVQVDVPPNELSSQNIYDDVNAIESVFAGIYSDLSTITNSINAEMQISLALNCDELVYSGNAQNYIEFYNSTIQTDNATINSAWDNLYKAIYSINTVLEGLATTKLDNKIKSEYIGEAKFIRAFFYFLLVNVYDEVPLVTETGYEINGSLPRSPVEPIYEQILSDLVDAKSALSKEYKKELRSRPNYYAACTLLAKIYLFLGDYSNAETESSEVIGSTDFQLSSLHVVFKQESKETIWQLSPVFPSYNTNIGRLLIPSSLTNNIVPTYYLSHKLIDSFEPNDERLREWIGTKSVGESTYFFPYKYQVRSGSMLSESLIFFRLSELYLIRAEARANRENLDDAIKDVNVVRKRSSLNETYPITREELLTRIYEERRHELFCEWGNRWFDLKRSGKMDQILSVDKGANWQSTDALWPIPITQIESNPYLLQNPGY